MPSLYHGVCFPAMFVTLEKVAAKGHVARVAKVVMNRLAKTTNKEVDFFENIPSASSIFSRILLLDRLLPRPDRSRAAPTLAQVTASGL